MALEEWYVLGLYNERAGYTCLLGSMLVMSTRIFFIWS